MPSRPDLIEAKKRMVAKPPRATKIGPQPQPSVADKFLHFTTGIPNPKTMPFAEATGPADVVMAAAPVAGGFKYLSGLADLLPKTSPARVAGAYRGLNSTRELSPELKVMVDQLAMSDAPIYSRSSAELARSAINKAVVPKLLNSAYGGRYSRRGFLRRVGETPGHFKDVKALQDAPKFWRDMDRGSEFVLPNDETWYELLSDNRRLVNMFGGVEKAPAQTNLPGLKPYDLFFKGAPNVGQGISYEAWDAASREADTALEAVTEIMRNPSIIGQRIRRILGLPAENLTRVMDTNVAKPAAKLLEKEF